MMGWRLRQQPGKMRLLVFAESGTGAPQGDDTFNNSRAPVLFPHGNQLGDNGLKIVNLQDMLQQRLSVRLVG